MGLKSQFWAEKSDICYMTPILVNGPFVALGETGHFPLWERFFDFPFPSYSRFHKKKPGWRVKKSSPSPLWGHRLPVTALALSACGLDNHDDYGGGDDDDDDDDGSGDDDDDHDDDDGDDDDDDGDDDGGSDDESWYLVAGELVAPARNV